MTSLDADAKSENSPPSEQGILIHDLSVTAGQRTLLKSVSASFRQHEITLIVGPSGVGKSILLRSIAGLLPRNVTDSKEAISILGDIEIDGESAVAGRAGVVFQSFALFDELSATGNVLYAKSSGGRRADEIDVVQLLKTLNVPANVPTSRLSGGQRQRLAIARTLAANPSAILYDEPTSGLDPMTGQQVANLIRETHEQFANTSVIVTHDYVTLLPIADRVFLLDPEQHGLEEIPREQWSSLSNRLAPLASVDFDAVQPSNGKSIVTWLANGTQRFFERTTDCLLATCAGLFALLPLWRQPVLGAKFLWHYARMVFGPTACVYLMASGLISGFVTTYFTFQFLPYADYTRPLLVEDLLVALGFAMFRIFVPVLSCVLIAARCGAAVTSDVGGRQFGSQIDAMKSFGTEPNRYLLTPIVWSFLLGTPLLTWLAFLVARLTSLITFTFANAQLGADFWFLHYHRGMDLPGYVWWRGTGWLLAKLLVSGFGIAVISYRIGRQPKYSTTDVSRSVTRTILWATLFALAVHFVFAFFEFEGIVPGSRPEDLIRKNLAN